MTPHIPITNKILNTADPTMVPIPTSPFVINTPGNKEFYLSYLGLSPLNDIFNNYQKWV